MVLGVALQTATAHASPPPVVEPPPQPTSASGAVLLLPAQIEGDAMLPEARRAELARALQEGLVRGGVQVAVAEPSDAACETIACRAQRARRAQTHHAVHMRVVAERRDFTIVVDVIDAQTERSVAQSRERCEVCGFSEVVEVIDSQAAAIGARLDALSLEPPVLVFDSIPPGAVVVLDGEIVGQTPFERVVEPGPHRVEAQLDGYVSEQRQLEAVAGVRDRVQVTLEPVPRPKRRQRMRALGWSALGIGGAALVVGVPLIVIDGQPNRVQCSGADVDPNGNCRFIYATAEAGIGLAVVGGVLLATGIGLTVATRPRRRGEERSTARIQLAPGLGSLWVQGRF